MSSYFFWCARPKTRHVAQTASAKARATLNGQQRGPSWCLRLKVRLLIHREEPLALPAAELIVRHSVHSFPLRKRAERRTARGRVARERRRRIQICLQRRVPLCKQSPRALRAVLAWWRPCRILMTGRELSTQPAFPDFI